MPPLSEARWRPRATGRLRAVGRRGVALAAAVVLGAPALLGAQAGSAALLWSRDGRPTAQAAQAVAVLAWSDTRGLRPDDYDAASLRARLDALGGAPAPAPAALARFDADLSTALARLVTHLRDGRVDPGEGGQRLVEPEVAPEAQLIVREMSRAADVAAVARGVEPAYAGYHALAGQLPRYRALAAGPDARPPATRRVLRAGDAYADAPALRRYLAALGDLPAAAAPPADSAVYAADLVEAVVAFQRRHGLEPDGVVGPLTMAQLRVPPSRRAEQIALTMERWRWLGHTAPERLVVVNVPAFRLEAFEDDPAARAARVRTKVIVGQAGENPTPLFVGIMREVVFRPYWDVPPSIAVNELLPKIRRQPGYLEREELEIVRGGDHDAVVYAPTAANLRSVAAGTLRLRQRPGALNALGQVKFLFPNRYNVYLHGTPAVSLFERARRDFSHGCIRVEDPTALAEWVLAGQGEWTRETIEAAMTDGPLAQRVRLERPVTVTVVYATVVVDDDARVHFYPDLYGHDAALARALR